MRNYMFLMLFCLAAVCLASHVQGGVIDPNDVAVTASSRTWDPNQHPSHVSDGSGMIDNDTLHVPDVPEAMWLSGKKTDSDPNVNPGTVTGTHWIRFDFDKPYRVDKILIWNSCGAGEAAEYGMKNVMVEYSLTGSAAPGDWTTAFQGVFEQSFAYQTNFPSPYDTTIPIGGALVKSVVFTSPVIATSGPAWNFLPGNIFLLFINDKTEVGLAEVRFVVTAPTTCNEVNLFGFGLSGDVNDDCYVTLADFADAAFGWLGCIEPTDSGCTHPWEL